MTRQAMIIALITTAALLAGCADTVGESQSGGPGVLGLLIVPAGGTQLPLETESFPQAFTQGRAIMAQYFTIASADQNEGLIQCLPKSLDSAPHDRIIGSSTSRQVATLRVVQRGGRIFAICSVQMQRQSSPILRQRSIADSSYTSVPNQTPAEIEAATTPDQNDTWETYSSDKSLEDKILNDLAKVLSGGA